MNDRRKNVINLLMKEIQELESEEKTLKAALQEKQNELRDIRQAISMLQSSTVRIPLSTKIIDMMQEIDYFASSAQIAIFLHKKEPYTDLKALKRDVNSQLNRMKKRGAVIVYDEKRVNYYGLEDWVDSKGKPKAEFLPKENKG